jgi:hypothetical protein
VSDLDNLVVAGQLLVANHTAVDRLIDSAFYYGPGVILTAVVVAAWRGGRWAVRRVEQAVNDRAVRRGYTARAARLNTVAERADRVLNLPDEYVNQYLEALINTAPDHARKEES